DRLLKAIDNGIRMGKITQRVIAQSGTSQYEPSLFEHKEFMPFEEMARLIEEAEIVVAHAGVGSTLVSLSFGKIPIIFPRMCGRRPTEHVDEHQMEFASQMAKQGHALVAFDEEDLLDKIVNYKALIGRLAVRPTRFDKGSLISFLRDVIEDKR
ncbi:MAG: glycosyltransferase, partial [Phycisphaerae bacterium]|nr:glycosyltransferase [Phycisphaerae bacterium]